MAARRAEYDYYQKGRKIGTDRFIPTPDAVIKVMLEAALKLAEVVPPVASSAQVTEPEAALPARMRRIVTASTPKPRR